MSHSIENEHLIAHFHAKGAELCSVRNKKTGFEFIWQATAPWNRHAPILFPIVGSLKEHRYLWNGVSYPLRHHGFARDAQFDVLQQSQHAISWVLSSKTLNEVGYPFAFHLIITYTLDGSSLIQKFRLINEGEETMPFSWGGHPAFNANPVDEYEIIFSADDSAESLVMETPYIGEATIQVVLDGRLRLDRKTFDADALIFKDLESTSVKLRNRQNTHCVELNFEGWPFLGIWSKPGADFVCLEPWEGLADLTTHNQEIARKEGIILLPAHQQYKNHFTMTFTSP